ncbi:MAG: putative quinol monooxygenase [Solirubrobacteraceae bacterium]
MAIVLSATWIAKPGREHVVREALQLLAPATRGEEGNLFFQVYQDPAEPGVFRVFELYRDDAAVEAHAASEHFARFGLGMGVPELQERKREFFRTLDF